VARERPTVWKVANVAIDSPATGIPALKHILNTRSSRAATLTPLLLLAACLPKFEQPDVRLEAVRIGSLNLNGGTLHAQLVVSNPNDYALRTEAMDFSIELNAPSSSADGWVRVADGKSEREFSVTARDSASLEIPVEFTWAGVGSAVRSALERGELDYRLTGGLRVTQPIRRSVPFRRTGVVNLTNAR